MSCRGPALPPSRFRKSAVFPPVADYGLLPIKILSFPLKNYGFPLFHSLPCSVILSAKGGRTMSSLIKILHIDSDFKVTYFIYRPRILHPDLGAPGDGHYAFKNRRF